MADSIDTKRAEERLDDVQADIDSQRKDLRHERVDEDEPKFSDTGTRGPVDDQIAPG